MASLAKIRAEAKDCRRCPLYANATQTVFGEGAVGALMLVGEQPGDDEDRRDGRSSAPQAPCSAKCSTRQASRRTTSMSRTR